MPQVEVAGGSGGLSEESVRACWKRFSSLNKDNGVKK